MVQGLASSQLVGVPPHTPAAQVSPVVHAFPSEQAAVLFVCAHAPVVASQLSVVHTFRSLQLTVAPARQLPKAHASPVVQPLPSSHALVLLT